MSEGAQHLARLGILLLGSELIPVIADSIAKMAIMSSGQRLETTIDENWIPAANRLGLYAIASHAATYRC